MVSLDNLKTAISAIKSEIVSRYLKKSDAENIYITKKDAIKSFPAKLDTTNVSYFSESKDKLTNIRKLRLPHTYKEDKRLGTVEYNPSDFSPGDLAITGASNIGFVFNLPYEGHEDIAYIQDDKLGSLQPWDSVSGTFASSDSSLSSVKKAALSNTVNEYGTMTSQQGVMYYNIKVRNKTGSSNKTELHFKLSASNNSTSPRLQGMAYGNGGELYYFISDKISSVSSLNIPFTITRIDGSRQQPINIKIYDRDLLSLDTDVTYDGTVENNISIYPNAINVELSKSGDLYYSDLVYNDISRSYNGRPFVFAKCLYDSLPYSLPLAHIDKSTRECTFIGLVNKSDYGATFMMFKGIADSGSDKLHGSIETYTVPILSNGGIVISSSTTGSTKKFKITVDDSGTISAMEV